MEAKLDQGYVVTLSDQAVSGYSLVRPLTVLVEQDEQGMFLASDSVTTVYGYGETGQKALVDYATSLVEYYELLEESAARRAAAAVKEWEQDPSTARPWAKFKAELIAEGYTR